MKVRENEAELSGETPVCVMACLWEGERLKAVGFLLAFRHVPVSFGYLTSYHHAAVC